jgi:hypothetical protein
VQRLINFAIIVLDTELFKVYLVHTAVLKVCKPVFMQFVFTIGGKLWLYFMSGSCCLVVIIAALHAKVPGLISTPTTNFKVEKSIY